MDKIKLVEICNPKQWKTVSSKELIENGKYPVYGANGIIGYYNNYNHENETVLITCRGATCGNVHISTKKSYINGNAMALDDLNEEICIKKYLYYYLKNYNMINVISGSAQPQITIQGLKKIIVKLYKLDNQKKIVSILDKVQEIIDLRKKQIEELDELIKSQFVEMFESRKYIKKRIDEVATLKSGTTFSKEYELENGDLLYCKVSDMNLQGNEKYMRSSKTYVSKKVGLKSSIPANSVIFPKRGGAIGTNKKRILLKDTCVDLNTMGVTPMEDINIQYLYYYFINIDLATLCDGSAVPQLNNKNIGPLEIAIPPIELQNQFAETVKQIDEQKLMIEKSLKEIEELQESLMNKYFG